MTHVPSSVPSSDGVDIAVHDLGGAGAVMLFAHANGFCGPVWAPLARHVADRFRGVAFDFRGHGDSSLPADARLAWSEFATDALAVIDGLGLGDGPLVGVGHSMGGAALLAAEAERPGTFRAIYAFEPIVPPPIAPEGWQGENPLSELTLRRRRTFPSVDAAIDNFARKPPLDVLHPDALRAYVEHGFASEPDGTGVRLKCDPEVEAAIYRNSPGNRVYEQLDRVLCPVTVAMGGEGIEEAPGPSAFAPEVAARLPHGRLERFPELGHFGPLEDPARVAAAILHRTAGI